MPTSPPQTVQCGAESSVSWSFFAVRSEVVDELQVVHDHRKCPRGSPGQPGKPVGELLGVEAAQALFGRGVAERVRAEAGLRKT